MRWAKSTRHQASVNVDRGVYNILCDGEENEELALSINGEYICDVAELPTHDEIIGYVEDYLQLNRLARTSFSGIGSDYER